MIKRATLFAVFLLLAATGQWASAQIFTEDFNYTAGDSLTGQGWSISSGGTTNTIKFVNPGLTFTGFAGSGVGNTVALTTTGQDAYKAFAKDSGNSFYSAFMINVSAAQATGDYFFGLSPAESQTNYYGRLFVKSSGAGFVFGLSKSNETAQYGTTVYDFNTTYLAVVKYTFDAAKDSNDTVTLYALQPAASLTTEPGTAEISVDTVTIKADAKNFGFITLRQGSASNAPTLNIDGIRIAKTWKEAMGLGPKYYSIGTGNVPNETEHYATLKAACDSLNADSLGAVAEDRIYYITSDLTEPANVALGINTNGHIVTFKPYTGITATVTYTQSADNAGTSGAWVIGQASNGAGAPLLRTTNIVIDGSNTENGTTRDLSFVSSTGTNAYPFRIKGDCDSITIKNSILFTDKTTIAYGIWVNPTFASSTNYNTDNLTIENCSITSMTANAGAGVYVSKSGTTTVAMENLMVKNNEIYARTYAIYLNGLTNVTTIEGNKIEVNQQTTGYTSVGINGVSINPTGTTNVLNNKFTKLQTANTTAGAYGIRGIAASGGGTWNIINNFISGFATASTGTSEVMGIRCGSTTNIYNNTIVLNNVSTPASGTQAVSGIVVAAGTPDIRNNIVVDEENDFLTYCIYGQPGTSNNNNFYVADTTNSKIGYVGAAARATLAAWQAASLQDANSVSGAPGFVSATDFHIEPTTYPVSVVSNAGTPVGAVTADIDGDLRDASTPDIGADEYTANPTIPLTGFSVVPASLNFGQVWKDSTLTDSVTVTNHSSALHLIIDSVKSSNPLFTVAPGTADLDTSATKKFAVTFSPLAKGAQSGDIIFYHNAITAQDTLKVSGMGIIKEPLFSATPASINFRGVLVGKSKMDSVTVQNNGTDSLKISAVASSDAVFTVTPTSANLAVTESQKFYITFSPAATGGKSASVVFTSNVEEGTDTVAVYGSGTNVISIADARIDANNDRIADRKATGDTVVVTGVITTPVLSLTQTSYFMQDASAGINLFSFNPLVPGLDIGDSVMVIGKIDQYRGLVELTPLTLTAPNVVVLKKNAQLPAVKKLSSHEFVTNAEMYEGQLVEVDTLYYVSGTWPASGSFASVFLKNQAGTDTLQMFIDSETNVDESSEPTYPINLKGVISQYSSGSAVYNNGYELVPLDSNDITEITVLNVNDQFSGIPQSYELYNNYPNPFNPSTTILYAIPQQSTVEVKIYSILGQEVKTLVNDVQSPSYYRVVWNGTNNFGGQVSSGVYFVRIAAKSSADNKSFVQVRKMLMMK